jgi:hypothetical protein
MTSRRLTIVGDVVDHITSYRVVVTLFRHLCRNYVQLKRSPKQSDTLICGHCLNIYNLRCIRLLVVFSFRQLSVALRLKSIIIHRQTGCENINSYHKHSLAPETKFSISKENILKISNTATSLPPMEKCIVGS